MAAKNDITGDSISSRVLSSQGYANFDEAFRPKPLREWYLNEGVIVDDEIDGEYSELVTYSQFMTHYRKRKDEL